MGTTLIRFRNSEVKTKFASVNRISLIDLSNAQCLDTVKYSNQRRSNYITVQPNKYYITC